MGIRKKIQEPVHFIIVMDLSKPEKKEHEEGTMEYLLKLVRREKV